MQTTFVENPGCSSVDRVRRSSAEHVNREIDRQTDENVARLVRLGQGAICRRIAELDREWDIERVLEAKVSTLALAGLVLGLTVDRKWMALPAVVLPFLLQHSLQGWCPQLPVLRRLGVRTRGEIDREKYLLLGELNKPASIRASSSLSS